MSHSDKLYGPCTEIRDTDFFDYHDGRDSLPSEIQSLENDELRVLLVALLSEWRTRTARRFCA